MTKATPLPTPYARKLSHFKRLMILRSFGADLVFHGIVDYIGMIIKLSIYCI